MLFKKKDLDDINIQIDLILNKIYEFELFYADQIKNAHPNYTQSARNLIHYLAYRSFDNDIFQKKLNEIGLPSSSNTESSVLNHLITFKTIINALLKVDSKDNSSSFLNNKDSKDLLKKNAIALLGTLRNNRKTQIMVTQPTVASNDILFVENLLKLGMNCARINCAHDDEIVWKKIIDNIKKTDENCKVMMDLAGPKLRTGKMKPGPKVIHLKPKRNALGQVTTPTKIWLAPFGVLPPENSEVNAIIPVNKKWLHKTSKGSYIVFRDSRDKKCKITIDKKEGLGRWASCSDSAFVTTDMLLNVFFKKKGTSEIHSVHEILPLEEVILLFEGDVLRIDKAPILGEPTVFDKKGNIVELAHISCTLPEIFSSLKINEPIYFDDGKIEGIINEIHPEHLLVLITNTKKKGSKLKADKGINLPQSNLGINGLTLKDKTDLKFVAKYADAVHYSFVNTKFDVEDLQNELNKLNASSLGIILKVETKKAYLNLPSILLTAMKNYPVGVMIARGDLAIETGWKNFAIIQEEIIHICEAAHIPNIWATQVLENLAKKGIPTRAEITDAAMSQRVECVMLNKGPYIEKALKMLDKILCKMQRIQKKKTSLMPKLEFNNEL